MISRPEDPEIRDQFGILNRVHQKFPNKFLRLLFWLCGCLELLLNREARAIREHTEEDIGDCIRQDTLT